MMARQVSRPAHQRQLCRLLAQGARNCRQVCPCSGGQPITTTPSDTAANIAKSSSCMDFWIAQPVNFVH